VIVDSSVLLAVLFGEAEGTRAAELLQTYQGDLAMSVVNLAECQMRIRSQVAPGRIAQTLQVLSEMPIEWIAATEAQAQVAAEARMKFSGLNFGDCFAYALAKERGAPLLTFDADFLATDIEVIGVES
jgi:ribonuclease VapC